MAAIFSLSKMFWSQTTLLKSSCGEESYQSKKHDAIISIVVAQIKDLTGKEAVTRDTLAHTYHPLLQRTIHLSSTKDSCLSILECQNS